MLTGLVQNPRVQTRSRANSYTSFDVLDGTGYVAVIAWGTEQLASNDLVEVRGTFSRRQASPRTGPVPRSVLRQGVRNPHDLF